jgi:hypothetical protein
LISIKLKLGGIQREESVEELNAERCPNLQELELVGHNIGYSLYDVLRNCPLLTLSLWLSAPDQPRPPATRTLDLSLAQCTTLHTLILSGYDIIYDEETAEGSMAVVPIFPRLQHLEIRDRIVSNRILQVLTVGGKLQSVFLRAAPRTTQMLSAFAAATPELQHLWLGTYDRRDILRTIPSLWPRIASLTVCSKPGDISHLLAPGVPGGTVRILLSDQKNPSIFIAKNSSFVTIHFGGQLASEIVGKSAEYGVELLPTLRVCELCLQYQDLSWSTVCHALNRIAPACPQVLQLESTGPPNDDTVFVGMLQEACKTGCEVRLRTAWLVPQWMKTQCPDVVFS